MVLCPGIHLAESFSAAVADHFDGLAGRLLLCVFGVPGPAFRGAMPFICELAGVGQSFDICVPVLCDVLAGVLALVFGSLDKLQIPDFIIFRVAVLMMDIIARRNRPVVELPHDAVQSVGVSAEIPFPFVTAVKFSVELLCRYKVSVPCSCCNCFHPFVVFIRWSGVARITILKLLKINEKTRISLRPLLKVFNTFFGPLEVSTRSPGLISSMRFCPVGVAIKVSPVKQ